MILLPAEQEVGNAIPVVVPRASKAVAKKRWGVWGKYKVSTTSAVQRGSSQYLQRVRGRTQQGHVGEWAVLVTPEAEHEVHLTTRVGAQNLKCGASETARWYGAQAGRKGL